jgi:hypothetical protein
MEYLDFELEIRPGLGRKYPVEVVRSPAGEASATMRFPFDELALENRLLVLQNALLRSGGTRRRLLSREEQTVQDFGKDLFNALVDGEVRSRFDVSLSEARQQGKGLRVKLRFQAPDLAALPWEFLYDQRRGEYLSLSKNTPTIRYLELPQPIPRLKVMPPLRILGMIASPNDLPQLDVEREKQRIERAVQDLKEKGFLDLTWLPGQTWRHLQEAMGRGGPWHIFHFIGHGGFDTDTNEGLIALADEQGRTKLLTATQVSSLLADHYDLRLVLLNSCEGARAGKLDIYSSTAAILVRRGIAAVLAMQYEITDRAAIEFSRTFYRALAYGLPIDASVATARIAVNIEVNNSLEWGTPVLYMRSSDGVLFDLASVPPNQPEQVIAEFARRTLPMEAAPPEIKGDLAEPVKWKTIAPKLAESASAEPEVTKHEPLEPKPLEPKTPKIKSHSRKWLIWAAAGLTPLLLMMGWWWFLNPSRYFEEGTRYVTFFDQSVYGLSQGSEVTYQGVRVGKVEKIRIAPDNRTVGVIMLINVEGNLPKMVVAQLVMKGGTGQAFVNLAPRRPNEPDLSPKVTFASEYPVIPSKP